MTPPIDSGPTAPSPASGWRPQSVEPDAAQIIATFADVERDYYAPVTDEAICRCARRDWGSYAVKLVPFGYAPLQDIDSLTLQETLDCACRGQVFLIAISHPGFGGLFGIMTVPRPREPWFALKLTEERWCTRGDRPPYEFGIDFNLACELRFLCIASLIRSQTLVIARPQPRIELDQLESRYASIRADASETLMIQGVDVSTWARFLGRARNAVRNAGESRYVGESEPSAQRRVFELAREAWPVSMESPIQL